MLPSAAAFVDPIFSTGFPLTLLGVERLARLLEEGLFAGCVGAEHPEAARTPTALTTLAEADHTARFVAGCYAAFPRFEEFANYSMFYFAVASFEEARRRLRPDGRGFGFLAVAGCASRRGDGAPVADHVRSRRGRLRGAGGRAPSSR